MSGRDAESRSGEPPAGAVPPWDPSGGSDAHDAPSSGSGGNPSGGSGGAHDAPSPGSGGNPSGGSGGPGGAAPSGPWQPRPAGGPFWHSYAPKPGVVPLRPLGVGEVLDGAVSYIRAHPRTVLGASLIVAVVSQLITVPIDFALSGGARNAVRPGSTPDLEQLTGLFASATASQAVGGLITLFATAVLAGLLVVVLSRAVLGAPVDGAECWRAARERVPGLLGVTALSLLVVIAIMVVSLVPGALVLLASRGAGIAVMVLGGIAGIVVSIWVSVLLSLAPPAYVLEGTTVVAALRRSAALVRGRWWPIFGIQLLGGLIAGAISSIVGLPFALGAGLASTPGAVGLGAMSVAAIGTIIGLALTAPFQAGVRGLLYIDQRMRREGFDIELQRASGPRRP